MGIFERMGRVASANFNALLDAADSPEKSLDLTLREMRDQLRAARREVVRALAAEKQLTVKVAELGGEVARWQARAELALRRGDEALARDALAQKRRVAEEQDRSERLRSEQRQVALDLKADFERMERKMEEFSARQGTLAALARRAAASDPPPPRGSESPIAAWQDMEDRIDQLDVMADAQREVDEALAGGRVPGGMTAAEVEARFAALEREEAASPRGGVAPAPAGEEPPGKRFRVKP